MNVSPGLSPIQRSRTSPNSTQSAGEPISRRHWHRQRVRTASAARRSPLRGRPGIGIEPGARAGADARSGGGELPGLGPTVVHIQSRLLVGDVRAGHEATPRRGNRHFGTNLTQPQTDPRQGSARRG
jgi:hypothetical protein